MESAPHAAYHQPALVADVLRFLAPRPGAVIVDGTCGTGGHALAILPHLLPDGRVIAIDRDAQVLALARHRLVEFESRVTFHHGNFRDLPAILHELQLSRVDGVLFDLGMSSLQVDQAERGFSFLNDGPLDMRMDVQQALTAEGLLNTSSLEELSHFLATLGEERFAHRIARQIVEARRQQPITTTIQLAQIIRRAVPAGARHGRLHPATRTFQALRMAVNDELGALEDALRVLPDVIAPHGRAVLLSFHSLEDRLVKRAFLQGQRDQIWAGLTKKPVRPTEAEVAANSRVRSVKLRAAERL